MPPFFHPSNQALANIFQLFLENALCQKFLEGQGHEASFPLYLPAKLQAHALELPVGMVLLVPASAGLPALRIIATLGKT